MYPGQLDYGGLTLPAPYAGDAAMLRADYDVVAYFAVLDFASGGWDADPQDAAKAAGARLAQRLAQPWSIEFEQLSLSWGPAGAVVSLDCFPTPAG